MKKNIVVIGASRGIGKALCALLCKEHHVLALSRNIDQLSKLAGDYPQLSVHQIDLCSSSLKQDLEAAISSVFEEVDVLINNAGALVNKAFIETSADDIELVYRTNVFGLMISCQTVLPRMKKGSHIVNIGSVGGFQGSVKFPGLAVYSSSKAAVASFSECLATELMEDGIAVNCLALGAVQTEMLAEAFPDYQAPMGPETMAKFIADFALNGHQWMNGKIIPVSISTP